VLLAAASLAVRVNGNGVLRVESLGVTVVFADRADPCLRRLRRAPVE
jgi:hypothetical protein